MFDQRRWRVQHSKDTRQREVVLASCAASLVATLCAVIAFGQGLSGIHWHGLALSCGATVINVGLAGLLLRTRPRIRTKSRDATSLQPFPHSQKIKIHVSDTV